MEQPYYHTKVLEVLCLHTEIFRRCSFQHTTQLSIIIGNKLKKKVEKLRISQATGTAIQKFLVFLEFQKFLGNICSFKQFFSEKSHWVPLTSSQLACQLNQLEHGTGIKGQGSNLSKPKFFQVFFLQLHFVSLTAIINLQFSQQDHFQASPTKQEGVEGFQCLFEVQVQLTQPLLPDVLLPVNKTV